VITGRVDSGPNTAERARTVLAHAPTLTVEVQDGTEVVGVRAVDTDGSLLLMVSAEGLLGRCVPAADMPATVHAARLIPLLGPDRVLDAVSVYGSIRLVDADDLGASLEVLSWADPGLSADLLVRPDAGWCCGSASRRSGSTATSWTPGPTAPRRATRSRPTATSSSPTSCAVAHRR
jgi:hypothetical protein